MDAEWCGYPLDGMAAGAGISAAPLGHLCRADDDVPDGHRVADAPDQHEELGGAAAADRAVWRDRLHHGRGPAVHPSVSAGVVRLPRAARSTRELFCQFDRSDAGAPVVVSGAESEISLDRSG